MKLICAIVDMYKQELFPSQPRIVKNRSGLVLTHPSSYRPFCKFNFSCSGHPTDPRSIVSARLCSDWSFRISMHSAFVEAFIRYWQVTDHVHRLDLIFFAALEWQVSSRQHVAQMHVFAASSSWTVSIDVIGQVASTFTWRPFVCWLKHSRDRTIASIYFSI